MLDLFTKLSLLRNKGGNIFCSKVEFIYILNFYKKANYETTTFKSCNNDTT